MKTNLRARIREYITSEEGKVGIKSPLALGIATGSTLLAHAIISPTSAMACVRHDDCPGGRCEVVEVCIEDDGGRTCWHEARCV